MRGRGTFSLDACIKSDVDAPAIFLRHVFPRHAGTHPQMPSVTVLQACDAPAMVVVAVVV